MKRSLSLLLVLALFLGLLCACGEGGGAATPAPSAAPRFTPDPAAVPVTPDPAASPIPTDPDFPDRYPFTAPNEDDMSLYDTTAIRDAWASGDPSGLTGHDRAIYGTAKLVLTQTLEEDMSDYEKEEALYRWVVNSVNYDWTHQDVMADTPRESFTPYGGLVNRKAVCLGYATTFQLLMDLAGVECITVTGAAFRSTSDHAWNMVCLDGEWYCVDATWDANGREAGQVSDEPEQWRYFNVTSDYMAGTDHQWDYENTPEAVTGGKGKYTART